MRPFGGATYTCATLEVSDEAFDEIAQKFRDAGYDHVFSEGGIDMTHIMLVRSQRTDPSSRIEIT